MAAASGAAITAGATMIRAAASTCPISARANCRTGCGAIPASSGTESFSCGRAWRLAADPPERIGAAAEPAYKTRRFGKVVQCHYTFMHENLMDMNHQFLHRRTTGKVAPRYLGSRDGEGWIEVDYSFSRPDQKPPLGEAVITGALRGRARTARDLMTVRTEYPYQTLRMWTRGDEPVLNVWLGYTPVDAAQRRNRTFVVLSVRRPKIPGLLDWPGRCWPGSPAGCSRKIARSSRWNRPPMTRKAQTGTRKCFRRSGS